MTDIYTITISNGQNGIPLATATVEIDAAGTRMTEVRVEASSGAFVPKALAQIDFPLLVHTITLLSGAQPPRSTSVEPTADASPDDRNPIRSAHHTAEATQAPSIPSPAQEQPRLPRSQTPDIPADFGVAYWRLGSVAKVARHYDVPHHIAQDWIKSLQQQGKLASPWPRRNKRPSRSG
ncbi:hypothetical protein ABZV58_31025 [Nocardia sp. NPDC004654]|uniref:hypothetical protein n=1 Tax=Nocardia sp. NPDC004654 TaxID=3154776 RepID=UPI0033B6D2B3